MPTIQESPSKKPTASKRTVPTAKATHDVNPEHHGGDASSSSTAAGSCMMSNDPSYKRYVPRYVAPARQTREPRQRKRSIGLVLDATGEEHQVNWGNLPKCIISHCKGRAPRTVIERDKYGPPGPRCSRHNGGPRCNVEGCNTLACTGPPNENLKEDGDEFGPPGPRCVAHDGGARCNIKGCPTRGERNIHVVPDEYGSVAGPRCSRHGGGKRCSVPGCDTAYLLRVDVRDQWGEPGVRCRDHGGHYTCEATFPATTPAASVERSAAASSRRVTCTNKAFGRAFKTDEFGFAGRRCMEHQGVWKCGVEGCDKFSEKKHVQKADEYGPEGLRCRLHITHVKIFTKRKKQLLGRLRNTTTAAVPSPAPQRNRGQRQPQTRHTSTPAAPPAPAATPPPVAAQDTNIEPQITNTLLSPPGRPRPSLKVLTPSPTPSPANTTNASTTPQRPVSSGAHDSSSPIFDMCNILRCCSRALTEVMVSDTWGPPGGRCQKHGGGTRCAFEGCNNGTKYRILEPDEYGPPGFRCVSHGGGPRCNIPFCSRAAAGRYTAQIADIFGPIGPRCCWHAGKGVKKSKNNGGGVKRGRKPSSAVERRGRPRKDRSQFHKNNNRMDNNKGMDIMTAELWAAKKERDKRRVEEAVARYEAQQEDMRQRKLEESAARANRRERRVEQMRKLMPHLNTT